MESLLNEIARQRGGPPFSRAYHCRCGRPIFFRNSQCLACSAPLGYEPNLARLSVLVPGPRPETWQIDGSTGPKRPVYRRCANFVSAAACNWLVREKGPALCVSCRLNRTIPDLSVPENQLLWLRIEQAKRRLVSSLVVLGLPVASRVTEDAQRGLAFDLLRAPPGGPPVVTGHLHGVITMDIQEADDAHRERVRTAMVEPYRSLLGHLRHEVGHYYWDRLVADTPWHAPFRALFGDERQDYTQALAANYERGPPPDWALRHVSAYASAHPWEDWAETWAHYLHMVDVAETALSFGLHADRLEIEHEPFPPDALSSSEDPGAKTFLAFVNAWVKLSAVLNELSRSMGQPDFYPFVLSRAAVAKLHFVHRVAMGAAKARAPA